MVMFPLSHINSRSCDCAWNARAHMWMMMMIGIDIPWTIADLFNFLLEQLDRADKRVSGNYYMVIKSLL